MKIFFNFIMFFILLINVFSQNTPIVIVNLHKNEIITKNDFNSKISALEKAYGRNLNDIEKKQVLKVLIFDILFGQEAEKQGIKVNDDEVIRTIRSQFEFGALSDAQIKKMVEKQGTRWEDLLVSMKRSLSAKDLVLKEADSKLLSVKIPSEKEVVDYYEANKTKFVNPDILRASHIFFSAKDKKRSKVLKKAKYIASQINLKKVTFEEAVRKYSEDDNSKSKNGDLGFLTRGDKNVESFFGSDFVQAVFKYQKGDISNPIASKEGFHIIKIIEKYSQKFLAITDKVTPTSDMTVKEAIKNNIVNSQRQQIVAKVQQDLYIKLNKTANIQILDSSLK